MERIYAVWLLDIFGAGSRISSALCEHFSSFEDIYNASSEELAINEYINFGHIEKLQNKNLDKSREIVAFCDEHSIDIITYYDVQYPKNLKNISDFPVLLFVKGRLPDNDSFCIGVVGTRKPSIYGTRMGETIACDLAKAGAVIVSGMARGIDSVAHKGAIKADGITVAVLGCGVDVVYPPENKGLMGLIQQNGAVVSEFPPMTPPLPTHFPVRNRIVSGISSAVLVVEGKSSSGSTITANLAKDQGREVFCLPGNADNPMSCAPNMLIREGARLITGAKDILSDMAVENPQQIVMSLYKDEFSAESKINKLPAEQKKIAEVLDKNTPTHIDRICFETGIEIAVVNQCLFMLELEGIVKQLPGKQYILSM